MRYRDDQGGFLVAGIDYFYGENKKIHLWAYDAEQGQEAWAANINGVIKLEQFIESKEIEATWIDSAKSVASGVVGHT